MHDVDAVIVGAGVVGLAVARRLAAAGLETIVLEACGRFGTQTSSRNSEVIHAGIHYAGGSLKGRLCVKGRDQIYHYCAKRSIPHRRIGKIILAGNGEQEARLDDIVANAEANGVNDLQRLSSHELARLEPELPHAAALLSPSTGIIDSHALMESLVADLEEQGGRLVCRTKVNGARLLDSDRWAISIEGEAAPVLHASCLVNCAGLHAHAVAGSIEQFPADALPPLHLARGVYYAYPHRVPCNHLIYPVPVPGGLGVHLTLDLDGRARFGPNVEWLDAVDYTVSPDARRDAEFHAAARSIFPQLDVSSLSVSFAGIRPKLSGPGEPPADFLVMGPGEHGLPNHVGLFGIESPGLTSSLALADEVAVRLALPAVQ